MTPAPTRWRDQLLRRLCTFRRADGGATLVEFALCAIVFILTILGTLEFGLAIWRYNMVSDLAQQGARYAAVRGTQGYMQATVNDVKNYVVSRSTIGTVVANVTVTSPSSVTGACTGTSATPGTLVSGAGVCVTVTSPHVPLTGLLPQITMNMSSTAKMVMAR